MSETSMGPVDPDSGQGQGGHSPPRRKGVIVTVPKAVRDAMHQRRADTNITFTDLALDAVESLADRLPDILAAESPSQRPGRIFARTSYNNQRVARGQDDVTINLQMLESDVQIIDSMWKQAGARNRSHYLQTALTNYLKAP